MIANNNFISTASAKLFVAKIQNGIIGPDEAAISKGNANVGNSFRYDSTDNQYIFNLDTNPLSPGSWQLKAALDDGTSHTVVVSVK